MSTIRRRVKELQDPEELKKLGKRLRAATSSEPDDAPGGADGKTLFSKQQSVRFPKEDEILKALRQLARERALVREDRLDGRSQIRRSGYSGNIRHRASTSARTMACTRPSSGEASTRAMSSPMRTISVSPMPRVVTAGVPGA